MNKQLLPFIKSTGFVTLLCAISPMANAQLFNVDFNDPLLTLDCASTYAAAGTAGVWNSIIPHQGPPAIGLVDKSGAATGVTMSASPGMFGCWSFPNPAYTGEDANLMQDFTYGGPGTAEWIEFAGLANGTYIVYTYAQAPDIKTDVTAVDCTQSIGGVQNVGGGPWPGSHQQFVSYAKHTATVTSGLLHIDISSVGGSWPSLNGFQIEADFPPGTPYCFGDGTGANCPCSAFGGVGEGCANTTGSGATLTGSGSPSVSADSFQLDIAGVPGDKPGLILRGDNQVAVPAGDGILCTTGSTQRSHVQVTVAGATTFTDFNGSGFGAVANLGTATKFQFWYRDPGNTCSGGGFNFTNGWTVNYQP